MQIVDDYALSNKVKERLEDKDELIEVNPDEL